MVGVLGGVLGVVLGVLATWAWSTRHAQSLRDDHPDMIWTTLGDTPVGWIAWNEIDAAPGMQPASPAAAGLEDPLLLCYTSGSTGVPTARNHSGPKRATSAKCASVSTFWTSVGAPPTPRSNGRGGVNVEAKLLMLGHAFEAWGCRRVELKTDALNERSRGAMEAMGATFEGIHRKHMLVRQGENRDSAWYSVVDDEWPRVRDGLATRLAQL